MRLAIAISIWWVFTSSAVNAASWGGYVYHEGESEEHACREAKLHALDICEKNGETFDVNGMTGYCRLYKTEQQGDKTIYYVNLMFACEDKPSETNP
jgi:hypothetical protein